MNRRAFVQGGLAALALSASDLPSKRVGLIGCGWYGKADIFRLLQVAPVEIVSLCDGDRKMLAECAEMVAARQASKKKPRMFTDYREMLKEKDLDLVVRDQLPIPNYGASYQSGMYLYDGTPKLSQRAFAFPFVIEPAGHGRWVWWTRAPLAGRLYVQRAGPHG